MCTREKVCWARSRKCILRAKAERKRNAPTTVVETKRPSEFSHWPIVHASPLVPRFISLNARACVHSEDISQLREYALKQSVSILTEMNGDSARHETQKEHIIVDRSRRLMPRAIKSKWSVSRRRRPNSGKSTKMSSRSDPTETFGWEACTKSLQGTETTELALEITNRRNSKDVLGLREDWPTPTQQNKSVRIAELDTQKGTAWANPPLKWDEWVADVTWLQATLLCNERTRSERAFLTQHAQTMKTYRNKEIARRSGHEEVAHSTLRQHRLAAARRTAEYSDSEENDSAWMIWTN